MFPATIEQQQFSEDRRRWARRSLSLEPGLTAAQGEVGALVHNISRAGLVVETDAQLAIGETIHIDLPRNEHVAAQVVWCWDGRAGCQFHEPLAASAMSAAILRGQPRRPAPGGASARIAGNDDEPALSPRQKLMVLAGLGTLLWLPILVAANRALS